MQNVVAHSSDVLQRALIHPKDFNGAATYPDFINRRAEVLAVRASELIGGT